MKRLALALALCVVCTSCEPENNRKETFPVTGTITIDGKPGVRLQVKCHSTAGFDTANPTVSAAFTEADGKFAISTYEKGDGIPAGEYTLTVEWGTFNAISMSYSGDKLYGKYADPETSEIKFTVEPGVPTDPLTIELTTD